MRTLLLLLALLIAVGCSAPVVGGAGSAPTAPEVATLTPAEAHPTALVIDQAFDTWDQAAIRDAAASWCALEPTLCLTVTVGPVVLGQPDSIYRDSATPGCPWYGQQDRATAQITIPDSCAKMAREHRMTVGLIATHELGHYFGAVHVPESNNVMSGGGPRSMARCLTASDLGAVCAFHDCTAPRYDLVCSDAEAVASNPYTPYN